MKIIFVESLKIPEIKIIRFERFLDNRGYFTESYNKSQFSELSEFKNINFVQHNESYSNKNVIRGLHFQWNPFMGKLVRTISGHMIDLILDIRKGSPTYGCIIAYNMPSTYNEKYNEWIWIPPGFAHGNVFIENTRIEYLCSGEYNKNNESGICPFDNNINWNLCNYELKNIFKSIIPKSIVSDKDKNSLSLLKWTHDNRSNNFIYKELNIEL